MLIIYNETNKCDYTNDWQYLYLFFIIRTIQVTPILIVLSNTLYHMRLNPIAVYVLLKYTCSKMVLGSIPTIVQRRR